MLSYLSDYSWKDVKVHFKASCIGETLQLYCEWEVQKTYKQKNVGVHKQQISVEHAISAQCLKSLTFWEAHKQYKAQSPGNSAFNFV